MSSTEGALRKTIQQRPRNGRARAELALLLFQQAKKEKKESLYLEALKWAEDAALVAPTKPYGHVARSMIVRDHDERMDAIHRALQMLNDSNTFVLTRIELMIRLLVEPRRHSSEMRRELNKEERALYKDIVNALASEASRSMDSDCTSLGQAHYHLGKFFRKLNPSAINQPRARHHFGCAIQLLPTLHEFREMANFWLATLDDAGSHHLSKCPPEYIVSLYSTFAERFDDLLVTKLSYQTPKLLRMLVDQSVKDERNDGTTPQWAIRAADLGCGTGLSGLAFCDICQHLTGVDLSPEMIERAREKACYEELIVGDVTTVLSTKARFHLVFCCDVFCYLGDLSLVFSNTRESLVDNGVFAFSTELLVESAGKSYQLHECARFAHKQSYVMSLAQEHGFEVTGKRVCAIRKNKGKDVRGLLVVFRKEPLA